MLIFYFSFGKLAKIPSDGLPYPLFCYAALVPWSFFAAGLTQSSNSLVGNSNLITKVYFPRLVIPLATVLAGIIDFLLAFALLIGMMAWYGIAPALSILWLPLFLLLTLLISLGVGLWLSALNVEYRDVRYIVPFLAQFWMLATPIAYPSSFAARGRCERIFGLKPNDRRDRRISLGAARHKGSAHINADRLRLRCADCVSRRCLLFPPHGENFRRHCLTSARSAGANHDHLKVISSPFNNIDQRCLIIGEVAQTHDGSLGTAHAYVDAVARAGADAIKFQTHIAEAESTPGEPWRVKFSRQDASRFDYWRRMEFSEEQWIGLAEHAREAGLIFLSSAFSFEAVDLLDRLQVPAWKVGAGETLTCP